MSYSIPLNGLPHGDPLNSYTDREAREERRQVAREKRERFGEAGVWEEESGQDSAGHESAGHESTGQEKTKGHSSDKFSPASNGR